MIATKLANSSEKANGYRFNRLALSEWIKILSVPLPGWGAVVCIAVGAILALVRIEVEPLSNMTSATNPVLAVAQATTMGVIPSQLFAMILGLSSIAGERSTGTIRVSLATGPHRVTLFMAKALVVGTYTATAGLLAGLLAGAIAVGVLLGKGIEVGPAMLVSASLVSLCAALYLGLIAILAFGVGTLVPRTVATLVLLMLLFILPTMLEFAASRIGPQGDWLTAVLPSAGGSALYALTPASGSAALVAGTSLGTLFVPAWAGGIIVGLWATTSLAVGLAAFVHQDATGGMRQVSRRKADIEPASVIIVTKYNNASPSDGGHRPRVRLSFAGVLGSEWTKLRSVASIRWLAMAAVVTILGYGIARAAVVSPEEVGGSILEASRIESVYAITAGIGLAQLFIGTIAAMTASGEYSGRAIRMSLAAVPRRWMLPSAKTLIVVTTTIALSVPILALTAAIVAPIQRARGFQPETLGTYTFTTVFSGTLYLVLVAMLSVGVGGFLRSTIGSVITICSLLIVGPSLFNVILALTRGTHLVWIGNLGQLLPSSGGLFYTAQLPGLPDEQFSPDGAVTLTPIQGLAILTAWALIALVVWIINLYRRDAH